MEEVGADGFVVRFNFDAAPVLREVMPVEQHRAERSHQAVGDVLGTGNAVVILFRQHAAQRGDRGAHHVHRVRGGGDGFEHRLHRGGNATQRLEFRLVGGELRAVGELAVDEQMGDLLELADIGDVEDIVAAIMQIIAGAANGAQRGVPRGDAGQGDRFFRLEVGRRCFAHIVLLRRCRVCRLRDGGAGWRR